MIPIVVLVVLVVATAADKICTDADVKLLEYVDWQLNSARIPTTITNRPEHCKCTGTHPIAFNAWISKTLTNLPSYAVVIFNHLTLNKGSGYNSKTGIFKCPDEGIYSFSWTIRTASKSRFPSHLVVDGRVSGYNYNDSGKSESYKTASQTVVLELKKGNQVRIRTDGSHGLLASTAWSNFSGFRIL